MKKDYLTDDGKVRGCYKNYAKMNVFEYVYYSIFHWNRYKYACKTIAKEFIELISSFLILFIDLIAFIFYPIFLLIQGFFVIRKAKKK